MPIKVNITLSSGGRFKPVSSHTLHDKLITVGRDKECTISLEDTQKHVSRMHAEIEQDDDCYWVKVVSKVNPIAVNGKRYSYGDRVPVVEGDEVSVGLYRLEIVEAETAVALKAPPAAPVRQTAPPPGPIEADEVTFPPAAKASAPEQAPVTAAPRPATPAAKDPAPVLPESVEEEATYMPPVASPPPAPPKAPPPLASKLPDSAILDDEVTYIPPMWARVAGGKNPATQANPETTTEDLTSIGRGSTDDTRPPPVSVEIPKPPEAPAQASTSELDFDLSDAFDEAPAAKAPAPRTPDPEPEVEEDFSEDVTYVRRSTPVPSRQAVQPPPAAMPTRPAAPRVEAAKPAPEKPAYLNPMDEIQARIAAKAGGGDAKAKPALATAAAGPDKAVNAFLEGAGLAHLQVSDPEAFMRASGAMVRAAVGGVLTLLADRAEARKELGLDADTGADDNPVTSLASPDEVIAFLFDPKRPAIGNVNPADAFSDACADLRSHQAALVAALRAAVMTTLLKIDPKKIERDHGTGLGMLNITRKSKLWDISAAMHDQIARDIEQNFSSTFSAEILAAFAEHARKARGG